MALLLIHEIGEMFDIPSPLRFIKYRDPLDARQEPPSHLSDEERTLFTELVESCVPAHFVKSDLPLLVSFIQATLLVRRAATGMVDDPGLIAVFERSVKLQATLATRLRLAPQSRLDPKTVARQQPYEGPQPWDRVD